MHINIAKINFKPIGINIAKVDFGLYDAANYLCFTSTGDSTVAMTQNGTPNTSANKVIQYKLNGGQWQTWDLSAVTLHDGDKMYLKSVDEIPMSESDYIYKKFVMTGSIAASGNVMSLLNFSDTLPSYTFNSLFEYCTSLTTTPELPATTLAEHCYFGMFYECTSLTTTPALPATTLAQSCYRSMFYGCSSLTQAPELPATTLAIDCYTYMFYGCQKLNNITMLATNISATSCLNSWVNGVASTGTFTKAASMTSLPTGSSGIPAGWTVVDYVAA